MRSVVFAVLMLLTGGSQAAGATGNMLYEFCTSDQRTKEAWCLGYIQGSMEAAPEICSPSGSTLGQSKDIVVKFLKDYPELRHDPATISVAAALIDAKWACAGWDTKRSRRGPRE